jgi:hypothetical protein
VLSFNPSSIRCPMCRASVPSSDKEILMLLRRNAKEGQPWALFDLAMKHAKGRLGLRRDWPKAMPLLIEAGMKGYRLAQHNLGCAYRDGRQGVKKNATESRKWFEMAATGGLGPTLAEQITNVEKPKHHFCGEQMLSDGIKNHHEPCQGSANRSPTRSAHRPTVLRLLKRIYSAFGRCVNIPNS